MDKNEIFKTRESIYTLLNNYIQFIDKEKEEKSDEEKIVLNEKEQVENKKIKEELYKKLQLAYETVHELNDERLELELLLHLIEDASDYYVDRIPYIEILKEKYTMDYYTRYSYMKLWYIKWYVQDISQHLGYTKDQCIKALEEIKPKFLDAEDKKGFYKLAYDVYIKLGEIEKANSYYELLLDHLDDEGYLSDCDACIRHELTYNQLLSKNYVKAYTFAENIVNGQLKCNAVPNKTYPILAIIYEKLSQHEKALEFMEKESKIIDNDSNDLVEGISYYLLLHDYSRAFIYLKSKVKLFNHVIEENEYFFGVRYYFLLNQLFTHLDEKEILIEFPKKYEIYQESNKYNVKKLAEFFGEKLSILLEKIAQRNNNTFYNEFITHYREIIGE